MLHLVRKNILELLPYSCARDEYKGEEGVFLDANESPFGDYNRYPDPYQRNLKQAIATIKEVNKDNIFIGNGSDEVIDVLYRIFCYPSIDKTLLFTPTYGMYEVSANINDIEVLKVPLNEEMQPDLPKVLPLLNDSHLKLLWICSPNNPTGNLIQREIIIELLEKFQGIVIIDEAYIDFAASESWISQLPKYPNLVVCQTLSKAWGLASTRIGIAYSSKEIIGLMNKVKPPYNVSTANQKIALETLQNIDQNQKQIELLLSEKERVVDVLSHNALIQKIYPSDANFILMKVNNATKIYKQLIDAKVIVRNRHSVIDNCLRITIGTPEENDTLIQGLTTIQE